MKILIVGGTDEARMLADALVEMGQGLLTSFAGRATDLMLPQGEVRAGGFGGARGLSDDMLKDGIERPGDATHPYSVQIATKAVEDSQYTRVLLVRLMRPPWKAPRYA